MRDPAAGPGTQRSAMDTAAGAQTHNGDKDAAGAQACGDDEAARDRRASEPVVRLSSPRRVQRTGSMVRSCRAVPPPAGPPPWRLLLARLLLARLLLMSHEAHLPRLAD